MFPLVLFLLALVFSACTDYVGEINDQIEEYKAHENAKYESMLTETESYVTPASVFEGTFIDVRDSQFYRTVTIGSQTWMAENLNYETAGSYCYNDEDSYCATYGRLYTWASAMDSAGNWSERGKGCGNNKYCVPTYPLRGVCPEGWHLPSYGDWETLLAAVDETKLMVAAQKLKAKSGWHDNDNYSDEYEFSVLPAGAKTVNGKYFYEGNSAYFWTSTEDSKESVSNFYMSSGPTAYWSLLEKSYGASVRCVKDVKDTSASSSQATATSEPATFVEPCKHDSIDACKYGTLTDERDGKVYKTVTIGIQTWMAENLDYVMEAKYSHCSQSENASSKFGQNYTWAAAMDSLAQFSRRGKGCGYYTECTPAYHVRGVCPAGWHLPTIEEFERLIIAVGGSAYAGEALKSTDGWFLGEGNGTDSYGFSAYPTKEDKGDLESATSFWSSSEDSGRDANCLLLGKYADASANNCAEEKCALMSVRCVMD